MSVVVNDNGVWEVILAYEVFLGELLYLIGHNFSQWSCLDPLGEVIDFHK